MQRNMKTYIQPKSTEINIRPIQMLAGSPGYGNVMGEDGQLSNRNGGWDSADWSSDADVEE